MTEIVFSSGHLPAETRALCQMYTVYIYFGIMLARLDFELGICTAYVVIYNNFMSTLDYQLNYTYHCKGFII